MTQNSTPANSPFAAEKAQLDALEAKVDKMLGKVARPTTPAAIPFILTAPVTAAQIASAPLNPTMILSPEGKVIVPQGRLNWAFHGTHEGDAEGFADWVNAEADRIG